MKLKEEEILKHVNKIRKEIGHDEVNIDIKEIIFNEKEKELWIIATDRPDKSAIIGKGGWVVGRLKEELDLNSIHVESYSDYLLKEHKMELSLKRVDSFIKEYANEENTKNNETKKEPNTNKNNETKKEPNTNKNNEIIKKPNTNKNNEIIKENIIALKNLKNIIETKINNIYSFNFDKHFKETSYKESKNHTAIVALSGGTDSSFSLILAKKLGFNPIAISIDPGTIVLPKQFKTNINNLTEELNVKQEYLSADYNEIIKDSFNGRYHPCGRCSSTIKEKIYDYAVENNIQIVIFGDMLATGSQCITKQDHNGKIIYRLNLPAALSVGKMENKSLSSKYNLKKIEGFGCPLLYEVHKKFPHMKKYSIQRILRETRSGALEPGEALDLIWSFYKTK